MSEETSPGRRPGGHPGGHPGGGHPSLVDDRDALDRVDLRERYAGAPRVITWEITQACDLECTHCRADAEPDRSPLELSTAEAEAVIDDIASFGPPPPILVFSGGDPLKRPDLTELIRHADERELTVAVIPAPTSLVTRDVVRELKEAGTRRLALSLDGATAERHDAFRGEPGSFEAALTAAEHARAVGLPIQVNSTVTRETAGDFPALAGLLEELGAVMWEVFFLVPVGRGTELEPLDAHETEAFLAWLYRRQREASFKVITVEAPHYRRIADQIEREESGSGVTVGSTSDGNGFAFIGHTGGVCPSGFLPLSAGNAREVGVVHPYRNSPLFLELRDKDGFRGRCGACEYRHVCGGSRARAWSLSGDWLEEDPFCAYVPDGYEGDATIVGTTHSLAELAERAPREAKEVKKELPVL